MIRVTVTHRGGGPDVDVVDRSSALAALTQAWNERSMRPRLGRANGSVSSWIVAGRSTNA